jgi:hypothetical protein
MARLRDAEVIADVQATVAWLETDDGRRPVGRIGKHLQES